MTQKLTYTLHGIDNSYRTINDKSQGYYREKGSKFIAYAFPVKSESEIKAHLEYVKNQNFGAHHHCYAWMLGVSKDKFRAFDDGEPKHSAGDPILGQIRSFDVTNVLVIVVRYFGGTKLGVGGLIQAYKAATFDALRQANIIVQDIVVSVEVEYDFSSTAEIMRLVSEFELKVLEQSFEEKIQMRVEVLVAMKGKLEEKIELLQVLGHNIKYEIGDGDHDDRIPETRL